MQTNLNSSAVTQRKITENMFLKKNNKKNKLWSPNYASFNFYVSLSERGWGNGHFVWDVGAISWADISTHFILQEIIAATSWKMWGREKHQRRERRDETSFAVMHIIWNTTLSAVWPPRFQECSCAQRQRCHVLQQDGQNHHILHQLLQAAGLQCLDRKVSDTPLNIAIKRKHFSFWRSRNTKTPPRIWQDIRQWQHVG